MPPSGFPLPGEFARPAAIGTSPGPRDGRISARLIALGFRAHRGHNLPSVPL
jgi:hypothetical protein